MRVKGKTLVNSQRLVTKCNYIVQRNAKITRSSSLAVYVYISRYSQVG